MSEELFDVVFFGILQTGKDKEAVMQNMAKLFKTEPQKLAPYFAGGRKVIKGKINAATAEKYKAALENVGLVVKLDPHEGSADTEAKSANTGQTQTAQTNAQQANNTASESKSDIATGNISMAEVGADVLEHPAEVTPQKIDDISDISMAEAGADVLEHPVEVIPQKIDDISDISIADIGADVLEHPAEVVPQVIEAFDASLAEVGADVIENPKPKKNPPVPDTSELSLD